MTAPGGGWKYPPAGVPTEPEAGRVYVSLSEARERTGKDRRTLQRAVERGDVPGWARPGLRKLHWFVYQDGLPAGPTVADDDRVARLEVVVAELLAQVAELRTPRNGGTDAAELAELRARVVVSDETNLQLIAAQDDLEQAAQQALAAAQQALTAGGRYRRALAQVMTPGHVGDLRSSALD